MKFGRKRDVPRKWFDMLTTLSGVEALRGTALLGCVLRMVLT